MKEKGKRILNIISEVYIFIIIIIFPLLVDKTGYFHILEFKWSFYFLVTISYLVITILMLLYFLIIKKINYFKDIKLSIIQKLMLVFLMINILSYFLSPYFSSHNLLIGSGRGEGLLITSLYILSFLFLSIFSKFEKRYFIYFSVSSILFSLICISQYIGFNPFNIYHDGIGTYNTSFIGTIGNVDFVSAYYTIFLTVSFLSFIFLEDKIKNKLIHFISFLLGFFVVGIISVKSGIVAFMGTFVLILPLFFKNNRYTFRTIIMLASVLFAYAFNIFLNPVYYYKYGKIFLEWNISLKFIIMMIIIITIVILAFVIKDIKYDFSINKKIFKRYYIFLGAVVIICVVFLFLVDFKSGFLHEIHEILHGNLDDNFGTYRIFLWKRTLKMIERPILGIGPDAFAIPFMARYTEDIISIGPYSINDTAANVYLTMLINVGFSGLITYLSFLFCNFKKYINNPNNNSLLLIITILCYSIQSFFNLSVVLVTPFIFVIYALYSTSYIDINSKRN